MVRKLEKQTSVQTVVKRKINMESEFIKKSKESYMSATLDDFSISKEFLNYERDALEINPETFLSLVLYAPMPKNRNYYAKTKKYYGLEKKEDAFLKDLIKVLYIRNHFFPFSTISSQTSRKKDIKNNISNRYYLFYLVNNSDSSSIICSLFGGLRDALAHGNVVKTDNSIILFSTRSPDKSVKKEVIKFILSIDKIERLDKVVNLLEDYKNKAKLKLKRN